MGKLDSHTSTIFKWRQGLPVFLSGFLELVFDRSDGSLLATPSEDAIIAIRQLTLMYGKIDLPCSRERVRSALEGFVQCETNVREWSASYGGPKQATFRRVADLLFSSGGKGRTSPFGYADQEIRKLVLGQPSDLLPRHGPGSTADKQLGNGKYRNRYWTTRLEQILPYGEISLPNWSYYDQLSEVDIVEPGSEIPVKVITVPKTLKTPRIIAMEPVAMQYAQQSILSLLNEAFRRDDFLRDAISSDDQTPNQRMAREGSLTGDLATLDLSEASDRVSNRLAEDLFRLWPHLREAVAASRSLKADVRGHGVIPLSKFASMGSALCFPIESMVFMTVVLIGIERASSEPLTRKAIKGLRGKVRVYGDDIICPVEYVPFVVSALQDYGFVVNTNKSFWNGKFRESCGKDYYAGLDVSVVRVRDEFPTSTKDASEVVSLVSLRNQLYWAGYWQTCARLDESLRKLLKRFPVVETTSPVLGRHSVHGYQAERMSDPNNSPLVKGWVERSKPPINVLDGEGALLKCLLMLERQKDEKFVLDPSTADKEHLERSGRSQAVRITPGWFCPY